MSGSGKLNHAEALRLYERAVGTLPGIERKGDTVPYTSLNGHMFSYLTKDGELALRLPEAEREPFLEKYKTSLCKQYGIVQKEYVMVPASLLQRTEELSKFLEMSHAYVKSLKPKPMKRKPK